MAVATALGQDDAEPLYFARLADGTLVAAEPLRDWHDVNATPRVGNAALFDPNRPVEWLVRDSPPVDTPATAYVEFVGGDRLPGEVIGFSSGAESPYRRLPPHLIVRPAAAFRRPNTEFDPPLRILTEYVRRVVWEPSRAGSADANVALLRDGRRFAFRVARWTDAGVSLLLEDRVETVPFSDLGELRFDDGDAWEAYFDHAATLLPSGEGRLIQVETTDGLVALASTDRLRPRAHGDNRRTDHWYQAIQPAWSLDSLWIRFPSITTWRFFAPERVPLTLIDPAVTRNDVVFSSAQQPQTNAASTGSRLTDGMTLFGWGFGTHAPCELAFRLPNESVAFHGAFGLDPSVGTGGCARVRIDLTSNGRPQTLFESELLTGAAPATATGRLPLAATSSDESERTLRLVSDPVYGDRPRGADPFDIRDAVNWFAPQVELDSQFVTEELRRRAPSRLPGIAGWQVDHSSAPEAAVSVLWDERDWEEPCFRSVAAVETSYLAINRKLSIGSDDRYLAVYAHCPHEDFGPARIQVRIDGTVLGELPVPVEHGRREPDPLLFSVEDFAGQTVTVELIQLPGAISDPKPAAVDWRGAELVSHRPGLKRLFEDEASFADMLAEGDGSASLEPSDRKHGEASLLVTSPGRRNARIDGWNFVVTEEPDLGEYRYVRFDWKAGGRGPVALSLGHGGQIGPGDGFAEPPHPRRPRALRTDDRGVKNGYRYVAGPDVADDGSDEKNEFLPALKIDGSAPQEWKSVQRDLYADFGSFALSGLALASGDGFVGLDAVYLARGTDQFRFLEEELNGPPEPEAGDGELLLKTNEPRAFGPIVAAVAPDFGCSARNGELQLLKEYRGRSKVLRTRPAGEDERQSVRLTTAFEVPADGDPQLEFAVSQHGTKEDDQKQWDLQVLVNDQEVLARSIDGAATEDGWLELAADLGPFAGQSVRIELRHKANGSGNAYGYWHDVKIVTQ